MTTMRLLPSVLELVDFSSVLAGHGYDVGGSSRGDSSGSDDEGGISMPWILAVVVMALVTVGILVSLNPSSAIAKLKMFAPKALILVIIATPLIAWTASAGGDEKNDGQSLIVERATAANGAPELLVSLGDDDLNTLETTNGEKVVRVECVARNGEVVLDAKQRWPFVDEPEFDYPHAHQPASREQLQRAYRCGLRGTRIRLEADVKGALTR
jgi:hypothetical protein